MQPSNTSHTMATHPSILGAVPARDGSVRGPGSLVHRNKKVVEQIWTDLVNGGRLSALDELVSPDFVDHAPLPGLPSDIDGLRERFRILHRAFPDFRSTIRDLIAENDKVVAYVICEGTHQNDYLGLPATGRRFSIEEIQLLRIVDGKLAEHWQVADLFGMLLQLGLAKSPW